MKRTLIILASIVLSFLATPQNTKAQAFDKGALLFDAGIGVPYYANVLVPPVFVNLEMGVHQYIGVGITGGYYNWKTYWYYTNYRYYSNHIIGAGFITFHGSELLKELDLDMGDILNKLDLYAKAGFGLNLNSYNDYYWDSDKQDYVEEVKFRIYPDFNFNLGARYYLSDQLGVFAEVGGGFYSYTQFGITFKLK